MQSDAWNDDNHRDEEEEEISTRAGRSVSSVYSDLHLVEEQSKIIWDKIMCKIRIVLELGRKQLSTTTDLCVSNVLQFRLMSVRCV